MKKSINFTVVPEEGESIERTYSNFCSISHTPFDFTLSFCEMQPLSEKELRKLPEGSTHLVHAPVRAKIVVPVQLIPALTTALEENWRLFQESYSKVGWSRNKVH